MIPRSPSIATTWFALAILFTSPSMTMADCQAWQLLRKFNAVQANGFAAVFELGDVTNGKTSGSAHYLSGENLQRFDGNADVRFDGVNLTIDVRWKNGPIGHYEGRIDNGKLTGVTKDKQLDSTGFQAKVNWVRWESRQNFKCAQEADATGPRCAEYARSAVQQYSENLANKCGFTGARWDSNAANHENWCRAVDPALPVSEKSARAQDLAKCRQTATINLQQKRRVDDILMKPK